MRRQYRPAAYFDEWRRVSIHAAHATHAAKCSSRLLFQMFCDHGFGGQPQAGTDLDHGNAAGQFAFTAAR